MVMNQTRVDYVKGQHPAHGASAGCWKQLGMRLGQCEAAERLEGQEGQSGPLRSVAAGDGSLRGPGCEDWGPGSGVTPGD